MNVNKSSCVISLILFLIPLCGVAQNRIAEPISLQQALENVQQSDKKVLIDVYASWCPYCKRMHTEVYPSEEVLEAISEYFYWVKIDVEGNEKVNYLGTEMTEAEFARALDNQNVPTTYFLNDEGAILGVQPGYLDSSVFSNLLRFVGSGAYLNQSFSDFSSQE